MYGRGRAASRHRAKVPPRKAAVPFVETGRAALRGQRPRLQRLGERMFRANATAKERRRESRKAIRAESQTWIARYFSRRLFCRLDSLETYACRKIENPLCRR